MSFKVHSTDDGRVPGIEYLPAGAITPEVGMALAMTGGRLAVATGAEKPGYISMCQRATACAEGELIPVLRVSPGMIFESQFSADASGVNLGDKLTVADDGLRLTAAAGGAAEVVGMDGTAEGEAVRVRFN